MTSLLQKYYETNYTLNCSKPSYLNTNEFLVSSVTILSPFSIILGTYGILVILFATPKQMESVKWFLFHYHVITFFIELTLNNLIVPLVFLPSAAVYCNGFLLDLGIPFKVVMYISDISFIALSLSMFMIFENRHSQIITIPYRMTKKSTKVIFYAIHYVLFPCFPIAYYYGEFDLDTAKLEILKIIPCPEPHFFDKRTQIITMDMELFGMISGLIVLYFTIIIQFFALQSGYYLLKKTTTHISDSMRSMQRKFFFILSIQIAVPILFMLIPNIIYYSAETVNQFVSTMTVLFVSFHGIVSSVILIVLHKPYRDFTWNNSLGGCIANSRNKLSDQSVKPNTVTMF